MIAVVEGFVILHSPFVAAGAAWLAAIRRNGLKIVPWFERAGRPEQHQHKSRVPRDGSSRCEGMGCQPMENCDKYWR